MKIFLGFILAAAIIVAAVAGCAVWVVKTSYELHPVGATATFGESADCLTRYANNYHGWRLDNHNVDSCFPTQTAAKQKALVACFNGYEDSHSDHKGWPEDNMRGCTWELTAVPTPVLQLGFGKVVAVPVVPRAGKRFALTVGVTRNDFRLDAHERAMYVQVTLNGEDIEPRLADLEYRWATSYASSPTLPEWADYKIHVSFTLPKTAEGKRLMIAMTIEADSTATATKTATFTVVR